MRNQNAARELILANVKNYNESLSATEFVDQHIKNYFTLVNRVQELETMMGTEKFLRTQAESWKAQLEKVIDEMEEISQKA